jgi:hypothetical protein
MSDRKALTSARLRDAVHYDEATGVFTWVNPNKFGPRKAGARAGSQRRDGYRGIMIDYVRYFEHRLAWLYVHGVMPEEEIDHINMDPSDNRLANLRVATRSQNEQNKNNPAHNTSGRRGVVWCASRGKWQAQIMLGGKTHFLGRFDDKDDAFRARRQAESVMFGDFAR